MKDLEMLQANRLPAEILIALPVLKRAIMLYLLDILLLPL